MSKLDFFENVGLNISSGVLGGCIVSFFVSGLNGWALFLIFFFVAVIFGIRFISEKRQKKDSSNNSTKTTEKVDEKGEK